jgi:hypothetical protein
MESTPPPVPTTPTPVPTPERRGWWARNWKWFVPTGCMTLLVLFAVFIGSILLLVFGAMKSTDVYKNAVARAKADQRVQHALGSNIHDGMFPSGKTNVNGASGEAELSISIAGGKGKGTIYVVANKSDGEWKYSKLIVKTDDGETIDLNEDDKSDDFETKDASDDDET